jgi:acyl-CoA synthetase (AMP-forming)/AMP-acid ligase II
MPFPTFTPTVPVLLESLVRRVGDRPFIVLGDERITYAEAEARSAELARGLLACGVGKGSHVGVLFPNGPAWVIAWLAAARIGAVVVPLNTFYKSRELGYVVGHADVHSLLTVPRFLNNAYLDRLEEYAPSLAHQKAGALVVPELPSLRSVFVWGDDAGRAWTRPAGDLEKAAASAPAIDRDFLARVEEQVTPADPMIVIYSSGSTAEPKGAIHTHGAVIRHSYNLNSFRDITGDDRVFSPMPFFWVGGFVFSLLSAMHAGAFMICEEVFEPGETLALLERERATIAAGWPHYAKAMVDHPSFAQRDLSSIRAGNLYAVLPEEARPKDPELRSNSLGMTETCGPHTIERMDVDLPEKLRGSFGRSAPGLSHKVVDPETGETLEPGEHGEICVRGYSLMQGLHKLEREDTFDADGYYHTGDGGAFDAEGYLFFHARLGDMIKTAGANVTPREVEVVLEAIAGVQAAFVLGLPDPVRGQNVAAAVVLERGAELDAAACRERLRAELSAYKVPRHFFFCEKAELPFTDSGKIDKRKLEPLLLARLERGQGAPT